MACCFVSLKYRQPYFFGCRSLSINLYSGVLSAESNNYYLCNLNFSVFRQAHWLRLVPALFVTPITFFGTSHAYFIALFLSFSFAGTLSLHPARFFEKSGAKTSVRAFLKKMRQPKSFGCRHSKQIFPFHIYGLKEELHKRKLLPRRRNMS